MPILIGIVLAIPMIVRVFAIPLATRRADRHDALRMAIVIAATGAVVGYGVVGLAQGAAAIAMAFVFASVFYTPIMPLADALRPARAPAASDAPTGRCGCGARPRSLSAASGPAFCSMSPPRAT